MAYGAHNVATQLSCRTSATLSWIRRQPFRSAIPAHLADAVASERICTLSPSTRVTGGLRTTCSPDFTPVPHLDTRVIGGQHSLLFGPYAGFSTRFLKHGSLLDLVESVRPGNLKPLLSVARDNIGLTKYLVQQVLQSESHRLAALDQYFPNAKSEDWKLQVAGQRVETIKPDVKRGGLLELGTEVVAAADRSLVALLGASPGASTAAFIAISVLEKCFPNKLTRDGWLPKLKEIIPSYGISLIEDADFCRRIRTDTAAVLKIENV